MASEEERGEGADRFAALFVWGIGAVLLVAALGYAARFSTDTPFLDDLALVPVLGGADSATPAWLWQQQSDHRNPLPKVIRLVLARATGTAFLPAVWFNFLAMGACAVLGILAARRIRGRTAWADAFFPLLFLHWGQGFSLLRPILVNGTTRSLLLCTALFLVSGIRTVPSAGKVLGVAAAALGLALCSTSGLILAVPLGAWVLWACRAAGGHGPGDRRRIAATRILLALLAAAGIAYFLGFRSLGGRPVTSSPSAAAAVALQALGQAFGPAGAFGWRQEGGIQGFGLGFPPLFSLGAAGLGLGGVLLGILALRGEDPGRHRAAGLAAGSAGVLLMAAAIGWGRAEFRSDMGLQNHYGVATAPILAGVFLLLLDRFPARWAEFVHVALFALFCALLTFNAQVGYRNGRDLRERLAVFETDARAGMSPEDLADRHAAFFWPSKEELAGYLRQMKAAGIGPYR